MEQERVENQKHLANGAGLHALYRLTRLLVIFYFKVHEALGSLVSSSTEIVSLLRSTGQKSGENSIYFPSSFLIV